jgi:hypothetical protein
VTAVFPVYLRGSSRLHLAMALALNWCHVFDGRQDFGLLERKTYPTVDVPQG